MVAVQWLGAALALLGVSSCAWGLAFPDEFYQSRSLLSDLSLKPPFYQVGNAVQGWKIGGSAAVSDDYIRLTSLLKGQTGHVSNGASITVPNFDVFVEVRVGGPGGGADGMVVWLASTNMEGGPALGGSESWVGAALALDSFDNNGQGNNPRLSLILNDGTKVWKNAVDAEELEAAGCPFQFRNIGIVTLRIQSLHGKLSVWAGSSSGQELPTLAPCVENVPFQTGQHPLKLSVTAATGGLFDNHDLLAVAAFEILSDQQMAALAKEQAEYEKAQRLEQLRLHDPSRFQQPLPLKQPQQTQQQQQAQQQAHPDIDEAELEKGLPQHHTRAPLAFHFGTIFKDLREVHHESHPDHKAFTDDLRLPDLKNLKTDEERYAFILDTVYTLEHHSDYLIKGFEEILKLVDEERFRMAEHHHQFAAAFTALYENVAMKPDVEAALQALAGKASLLKATAKIHKRVDLMLDAVEGPDSPVGVLGVVGKQLEPARTMLKDRHSSNRDSLSALQDELQLLLNEAVSSSRLKWLDWVMIAELAFVTLFVLSQMLARGSQRASLV